MVGPDWAVAEQAALDVVDSCLTARARAASADELVACRLRVAEGVVEIMAALALHAPDVAAAISRLARRTREPIARSPLAIAVGAPAREPRAPRMWVAMEVSENDDAQRLAEAVLGSAREIFEAVNKLPLTIDACHLLAAGIRRWLGGETDVRVELKIAAGRPIGFRVSALGLEVTL